MAEAQLTIDLAALVANWRALASKAGGADAGAVVKADAYGLGLAPVARALAGAGARRFFVAQAGEAARLRAALGPGPEIFVFAGYMDGAAEAFRASGAVPLLNSPEQAAAFARDFPGAPAGVQFDTGMNRLGVEPEDLGALELAGRELRLVMSHLACADTPGHPMNAAQRARFLEMAARFPGVPRSLAATGGILLGPEYHFDLVRPGVGLYGGLPFEGAAPVVTLELPVIQTRTVAAGETVGYGAGWTAPRPSRIATLSAGYADGILRASGGRTQVFAGAIACPLVGRVSMDLVAADVTALAQAPERLTLLGPAQGVDDLAAAAGTIGYEILTALGGRYARHYKGA